jgi:hypothetical protein
LALYACETGFISRIRDLMKIVSCIQTMMICPIECLLKGLNYYYHETTVIHYKGESTVKDGIYMKRFQESMQFFYKKALKVSVFFRFYENRILFFFCKMFQGQAKEKRHLNPIFCIRQLMS